MATGVGCDIGGTFTDLILIDESNGKVVVDKVLTTPSDPSEAIQIGLENLERLHPGGITSAEALVHGTTLVINAVIERKGAATGLITTKGFRDVLEIGREKRYDGNDLQIRFPDPLVARPYRHEVQERVLSSGKVHTGLDEETVVAALNALLADGIQSLCICLLNSFANPVHELRIAEIAKRAAPDLAITMSHEVLREMKEYERTTTSVVNAYTKPIVARYLERLAARLDAIHFSGELLLMQSSGGLNSATMARRFPVQIIESGPAAGAIGAAHYAQLAGFNKVLSFDMGGTTAKMCLVSDGVVARVNELEVDRVHRFKRGSGIPVRIRVVDLMEIGAGGGSIAKVSVKGTLEVGPESASAVPGPVCYGQGGTVPTVSDADLVLGYLNPDYFLGGRMALDRTAAEQAIAHSLGQPLDLSVEQAAWGIHSLVNENMASAAKVYVAEKGESPSNCAVVAFGGAGPVHAYDLAKRIGARTVVIPPRAGVASAFGMLIAPVSFDTVRTYRSRVRNVNVAKIRDYYAEMEQEARDGLPRTVKKDRVWFEWSAELRYVGQGYDVSIPMTEEMFKGSFETNTRQAFNEVYQHIYGRVFETLELEIMNLRVSAFAPGKTYMDPVHTKSGSVPVYTERQAFCPHLEKYVCHRVYPRASLWEGVRLEGPAIVEEPESTTIIGTGAKATVDASGSLIVSLPVQAQQALKDSSLNAVTLEMLWRRLTSSVDELAAALVRTSFSSVVRDVNDYACGVFDLEGRLLARSKDSTPGIAGGLGPMLRHMLEVIPPKDLSEGDVLIGNDPWNGSGHHNDIFVITPAFYEGRIIGYAACAAHHVDIGGRRATSASKDNYEEGLRIPVCKLNRAGKESRDIYEFIAANVRLPDTVLGDLRAQCSANHVGCQRMRQLCEEHGWDDLQVLADEVFNRSAELARSEISKIPDGVYRHEAPIDIIDDQEIVLKVAVTVRGDTLVVDFGGSSPQVRPAINCTLSYTSAYSNFAIGALMQLPVESNDGVLSPIQVIAEPGTIVNAKFPAPVFARTCVGNFIPEMIFNALANALPERVVAGSGATPLWAQYIFGTRQDGSQFAPLNSANGGQGGRFGQDGVSCLTFPVNIGNIPVEVLESEIPAMVLRRELWEDSAGPGRFRGGLGQRFELQVLQGEDGPKGPLLVGFRGGRFYFPVPGILGGMNGPNGKLFINSKETVGGGDAMVPAGGTVLCEIPGGGGFGNPTERSRALIQRDIEYGYITASHAERFYGYKCADLTESS